MLKWHNGTCQLKTDLLIVDRRVDRAYLNMAYYVDLLVSTTIPGLNWIVDLLLLKTAK